MGGKELTPETQVYLAQESGHHYNVKIVFCK